MFRFLVYIVSASILECRSTPCGISGSTMLCKGGEVPFNMSKDIRELYLEGFEIDQLKILENVSQIQKLDITTKKGNICDRCFYRFSNLSYLGLHVKEQIYIDQNAFEGLSKLQTLNLSSNPNLHEILVSNALNSQKRKILPKLEHLSISKIKTSVIDIVDLDYHFLRSITSGRNLRSLDISHLNIRRIDYESVRSVCRTVEYIDLTKSSIGSATTYEANYTCQSLRKLDISGMIIPILRAEISFKTLNFFCQSLKFYGYLNIIFANNVNIERDIVLTNYSLEMSACPVKFQKVSIAGNRIRWINITVHLHDKTIKEFTELNVSDNGMEYVSPLVLLPSKNIETLDFSRNKLHKMQEQYSDEFETLFWAQKKLRYITLSHNGLSRIPMKTFSENKFLKILDISFNDIEKIDFEITQLVCLENLLVRYNKIKFIEPNVRNSLQGLIPRNVNDDYRKAEFNVYLDGNRFECNCDKEHREFIKWLHVSEVFNANESITCSLNGDIIDVRKMAPTATERFCKIETMKKIALITAPIVVAVLVLVIVIAIFATKLHRNKMMIRQVISQIEMGTFSMPYLAFLSYCSEDAELVLNTIYPKLLEHLSEITHSNQHLVCIGDKHFRPGFPLLCEVMRCVEESSVLVAVISRNFCKKKFCMVEIKEACEQNKPVIMLIVEHVEKELMEDFLQKVFDRYAHASWKSDENGGHIEPEWKIFCKSILQLSGEILSKDIK